MVTAMLLRIHQSGHLAHLDSPAAAQVKEGIRVYKQIIREHIPDAVPFYPLGMPDVTNAMKPIALGIRSRNAHLSRSGESTETRKFVCRKQRARRFFTPRISESLSIHLVMSAR